MDLVELCVVLGCAIIAWGGQNQLRVGIGNLSILCNLFMFSYSSSSSASTASTWRKVLINVYSRYKLAWHKSVVPFGKTDRGIQQSAWRFTPGQKFLQLSLPQTRFPSQSESESQSPCPYPHCLVEVQQAQSESVALHLGLLRPKFSYRLCQEKNKI